MAPDGRMKFFVAAVMIGVGLAVLGAVATARAQARSASPWVFADSDRRYLSAEEIRSHTKAELWRARNEIYARRGLIFRTRRGRAFAASLGRLYRPRTTRVADLGLNRFERANIRLIRRYEGRAIPPAMVASEKARLRSLIKYYMGLVSRGDFAAAAKLMANKPRLPSKGSFVYWWQTTWAGAWTRMEDVKIKGNRASAILHYDPAVARKIAVKLYENNLAHARKTFRDPRKRASYLAHMAKPKIKNNFIAWRAREHTRSKFELKKIGGKWLVIANAPIEELDGD